MIQKTEKTHIYGSHKKRERCTMLDKDKILRSE